MVEQAIKLKQEQGVLGIINSRLGRKIHDEINNRIIDFYTRDNFGYIRIMPGKNDYISMGKGIHAQKILLLCNLH